MSVYFQDHRIAGVVGTFLGFIIGVLSDALSERIRRRGSVAAGSVLLVMLCVILAAIMLKAVPRWKETTFRIAGVEYSSTEICIVSLVQACLFLAHFVYAAVKRP